MPVKWKVYRVICIVQMIASSIFAITSTINFFRFGGLGDILRVVLFSLIFMLTILAVNILNNNYPDTPVMDKQKSNFNRLFLLNFIFLVFMFGIVFSDYRQLNHMANQFSRPIFTFPFDMFIPLLISLTMLIFQFVILYGLYELRRELYFNFRKKEFEFEHQGSRSA
jgi:hypothetical protein